MAAGNTPDSPKQPNRVQRLLSEYQTLRRRYGLLEQHPRLAGLDRATDRRHFKAKHLREQIEELASELRWLESELESFEKGRELLLASVIDELRTKFREAWSPAPMLGFRYWFVQDGSFLGFRQRWSESHKEARCLTSLIHEEVPHTDGRCGPPACGIYAAKQVGNLLKTMEEDRVFDRAVAVGLVGLSGKVVEHRLGYRAARAEVLAMVITQPGRELLFVEGEESLEEVFGDSGTTAWWLATAGDLDPTQVDPARQKASLISYLQEQERKHAWTSENKNE
jgi:hypothetical protein